ncbi:MAG: bifunctional 2-polyprenyl-6-hydroxyphenol methylase/3-demethylubiquinol 3-O-methyltransferase UbiG [Gammaproteobacteria bacterium]|nr:bifunctional 2-polyprenyl-6-hydroxyphenol methylase/3-demethylubiquinol 3-O-methyltransferase UbiG [Gammaproteobacteria bacterium]
MEQGPAGAQHVASIDPAEVAFYNQLADTWWDKAGPFWPLHRLNGLRTKWLLDRLCKHFGLDAEAPRPLTGLSVLDIGCGGGILSVALASLGARVHGIDVTERNIFTANHHVSTSAELQDLDIRFDATSAEELARRGARYDAVLSMEVVEHVADLQGFISANCALTRPGGVLALSTINRTLRSWLFAIIGAEYILRWLPQGTHQWSRFPRPGELADLLKSNGLAIDRYTGVAVSPLSRRFSLTSNLAVNYMLTAKSNPQLRGSESGPVNNTTRGNDK